MTGRESVAVAVLAAGILTACGSDDTGPGTQSIKIGGVFDLTVYGQGWAMTHILFEGIRRAAAGGGEVRGAAIREALESLRDFDMRGVTVPVTFTPRDHLGIKGMRI